MITVLFIFIATSSYLASRPVNEPNEHKLRHVRVRLFNFKRTRTYNQTNFLFGVHSLNEE
ncbi:hypothetical protein HanIR_Chr08g0343961 [Helianthus annuus]|nr:hypothetical protein HanIR_Chr08g0343961 [Helianthus annuus]